MPAFLFLAALFLSCLTCGAVTIYVDAANAGSGTMDGSLGDPWDTITKGTQNLAEVNDASPGGHLVSIAAGTYSEQIGLTNGHSGVLGSTNRFIANGDVRVDGVTSCFTFNNVQHVELNGFYFYSCSHPGGVTLTYDTTDCLVEDCFFNNAGNYSVYLTQSSGTGCRLRKCVIRDGGRYGIYHYGREPFLVEECTFVNNRGVGIAVLQTSGLDIRNSIIVGNGSYGLWIGTPAQVSASNVCLYANGIYNGYFQADGSVYEDAVDFAVLSTNANLNFTNIVVSNPGFSDMNSNMNFNAFHANSLCLKGNSGFEMDMGAYQDPPTVPVSSNTYYVDPATGNDGRSGAEAQNQATPWLTISRAARHAVAGDTVIVKPGTYAEEVILTNSGSADLPLTFRGGDGVIVEPQDTAFYARGIAGVIIEGFEFPGPPDGYARGSIWLRNSFGNEISDSVFYNNHGAGSKSGIRFDYSPRNTIRETDIYEGDYGVYQVQCGGLVFERCNIYSNSLLGISLTYGTGSRIMNCILYGNSNNLRLYGVTGDFYVEPTRVENCVLSDGTDCGVWCDGTEKAVIINTVIQNTHIGIYEDGAGDEASPSYCCFYNNDTNYWDEGTTARNTAPEINAADGCSNNIVADPEFVDSANNNYKLFPDSPCIDAGTPTTDIATDMFGNRRLVGPAVDMGVYEMPPQGAVMVFF